MMKISYYPDIFFLLVYNNQSLKIPWMMGGGQPIPAGLSYPQPKFLSCDWQWILVIAVNCFNDYKQICFTKYRYCLLAYKNPFLEIHPFTGGGQPIPDGLSYPPPMIFEQ